ncbi:unnamed protein product [Parajaminaea phylloscopi]
MAAEMALSPSPSPPPSATGAPPMRYLHDDIQTHREMSSSSISISRPPTGASSRSGDAIEQGDGQPPSPSSTLQSDIEADGADGFAADLDTNSHFTMADRRATLKGSVRQRDRSSTLRDGASPVWEHQLNTDPRSPANLPHEILLHTFKFLLTRTTGHAYLRNCLLVCRSWCLCGVELLWHRPAFLNNSSLVKLIQVIRRPDPTFPYVTFIRRLNFTGIAGQLENSLFTFMADCSRLERLSIGDCVGLTDESVASVLGRLKNLVSVDLTNLKDITDLTLTELAANCKRLQGLNLTGCKEITSVGVAALGENCPLLRRVKLCGCELVGDDGLLPMVSNCPMLLEIDVYNCPLISDRSVRQMWLSSSHVRELRLANCGPLTDIAFPAPSRLLTSSTAALDIVPTPRHPHVRNLTGPLGSESAPTSRGGSPIERPSNPTDRRGDGEEGGGLLHRMPSSAALSLTTPLRPPKAFEHLRILDLTACSTISDSAVEGIVSCAPRIRNLILSKCTRLTDETVFSISKLRKNLHYLHLGHVSNITDRSVCHLVNSCTRLRYFDLACCSQLTDLSVTELAAKLPKLKRIGLVRVTRITDASLYALAERHFTLQRIHLSYCDNISVAAVFWLLERLTKVTHISLTGVSAFRRPELQAMCRPPPEEFSAHQRESFCVYSGQGVLELQLYLRKVFSSEESAAQFGEVTPEVLRAVQLIKDNTERYKVERLLHYNSHRDHGGHHSHHDRGATTEQRGPAAHRGTRVPQAHPLASVAGTMQRNADASSPAVHPSDPPDLQPHGSASVPAAFVDPYGRYLGPWTSGPSTQDASNWRATTQRSTLSRPHSGDFAMGWTDARSEQSAEGGVGSDVSTARAWADPRTLLAAQAWYESGNTEDGSAGRAALPSEGVRASWLSSLLTPSMRFNDSDGREAMPEQVRFEHPVSHARQAGREAAHCGAGPTQQAGAGPSQPQPQPLFYEPIRRRRAPSPSLPSEGSSTTPTPYWLHDSAAVNTHSHAQGVSAGVMPSQAQHQSSARRLASADVWAQEGAFARRPEEGDLVSNQPHPSQLMQVDQFTPAAATTAAPNQHQQQHHHHHHHQQHQQHYPQAGMILGPGLQVEDESWEEDDDDHQDGGRGGPWLREI